MQVGRFSLFVAYDPLAGRTNLDELFMTVHLSHFRTMQDATQWLHPILGDSLAQLPEARILRLDRCVDLSLPFEAIRETVQQPRVARVLNYQGRARRSEYLGKLPRQTVLYEKWIEPDFIDNDAIVARYRETVSRVSLNAGVNLGAQSDIRVGAYAGRTTATIEMPTATHWVAFRRSRSTSTPRNTVTIGLMK